MKKIAAILGICLFSGALFADRVILRDATVINGKIIQVTNKGVEIDPEGDTPFDLITKDRIAKIVYDDGREVLMAFDKLYLFEGKVIEGKIQQVNPTEVVYTPKDSTQNVTIPREKIQTLQLVDGREINLEKETGSGDAILPVTRARGFHGSIFRIAALFGGAVLRGQMINRDEDLFDSKVSALNSTYGLRDWETSNTMMNVGGELDVMLPAFEFAQTGAFSFTGIKLGARGMYLYTEAYTSIYDNHDNYRDSNDSFSGTLMRYHTWAVGPVVYFIFSPRSNNFNLLFNLYVIAGQVFGGEVWGAPALRDANVVTTASSAEYNTNFSGYTVRVGWGPHFALNKWFPVTVGINVYYAYTRIKLDDPISVYSPAKTVYENDEWGGEISVGVHF